MMITSFICVFAVLINKVCLQDTVEGVIGGSVLLPCSSTEHDQKLQDITVHWRHNGSKIVCDIIGGRHSESRDPDYKSRAETFPEEYARGNFFIRLSGLTHTDAGEFICLISHSSEQKTVRLIINGKQGRKIGSDVVTSSPLLWVYIVLPVVSIVLI
ncbi:hypothetical protein R3I94_018280 [Phoxinus phoxinus]